MTGKIFEITTDFSSTWVNSCSRIEKNMYVILYPTIFIYIPWLRSQQHHNQDNPTPANYNRSDLSSATTNSESVAITCAQAQNGFWHQNGHFPTSSEYFSLFHEEIDCWRIFPWKFPIFNRNSDDVYVIQKGTTISFG